MKTMPQLIRIPIKQYRPKVIAEKMNMSYGSEILSFSGSNAGYLYKIELTKKNLVDALKFIDECEAEK
jgi:hypothetical protein